MDQYTRRQILREMHEQIKVVPVSVFNGVIGVNMWQQICEIATKSHQIMMDKYTEVQNSD